MNSEITRNTVAGDVAGLGEVPEVACRLPRVGACALKLVTVRAAGCHLRDERLLGLRWRRHQYPRVPAVFWCDRGGDPTFGQLQHYPIRCPSVLETLPGSSYPKIWWSCHPSNFRSISIVPVIAKIVERAVHQQLYSYLSENHLLSPNQHGFRPHHSTETALTSISDHILSAFDHGETALLCLLDLSKCFDVIDHSKLLSKLQAHVVDTAWFSAYLRDHTQSVSFTNNLGDVKNPARCPTTSAFFKARP